MSFFLSSPKSHSFQFNSICIWLCLLLSTPWCTGIPPKWSIRMHCPSWSWLRTTCSIRDELLYAFVLSSLLALHWSPRTQKVWFLKLLTLTLLAMSEMMPHQQPPLKALMRIKSVDAAVSSSSAVSALFRVFFCFCLLCIRKWCFCWWFGWCFSYLITTKLVKAVKSLAFGLWNCLSLLPTARGSSHLRTTRRRIH